MLNKTNLFNNYKMMYDAAVDYLSDYLEINIGIESLIVGISGGIDSAVVTAIAKEVKESLTRRVKLIGRSLPMNPTKGDEIERSALIGSCFCDDFSIFDLEEANTAVIKNIELPGGLMFEDKIRLGNIRARTRMIQLYHLAHYHKGIVLSTDNLTEYELGFWTLHGDVGDFGLIQNAWKTEVYGIAEHICTLYFGENDHIVKAIRECINAIPTDGLGITNSDLDQLGADSYSEVDTILINYLTNNENSDESHPVIQRHLNSKFKRNNPLNIPREVLFGVFREVE